MLNVAHAVQPATSLSSSHGSLWATLFWLAIIVIAVLAIAWFFKRSGAALGFGSNQLVKMIGGVHVGPRERVLVIEVAEQWIVIGVTAGSINTLATMPRQEHIHTAMPTRAGGFPSWLKQLITKRHGGS